MAERSPIDKLPPELLMEILSRLSWRQLLRVRRVSCHWQEVTDACLTHRRELHITRIDFLEIKPSVEMLLNLLQKMPSLRRIRLDGYCSFNELLAEGVMPVDRLCDSCPKLEAVSIGSRLDEADVETLLRRLPGLRSLHLTGSGAKGACLSLLPAGLQSLSLTYATRLNFQSIFHLTRCPQLRELDLSGADVHDEELAAVVAACPQLERLAVARCPWLAWDWLLELARCPKMRDLDVSRTLVRSKELAAVIAACPQLERLTVAHCGRLEMDWMPELRHCSQLQELDISGLVQPDFDLSGVLTSCDRLERLRVAGMRNPLLVFPSICLPGLTHLDLNDTETDDNTFSRLPDVAPGLRDLRLGNCKILTDSGLANVLPRLTSLQVLQVSGTRTGSSGTVLSSVSGLPLKALACLCLDDRAVDVLRQCPTLTVFRPMGVTANFVHSVVADLARDHASADRRLTLILSPRTIERLSSPLPNNIRVVSKRDELWSELVGW